jgi:hypothetical protein
MNKTLSEFSPNKQKEIERGFKVIDMRKNEIV